MNSLKPLIELIVRNAEANQPHDDSDYVNPDDGLLYCGKCHTPKRCVVNTTDLNGEPISFFPPVPCKCEREKREAEERRRKQQEEMAAIDKLRNQSLMDKRFKTQTFKSFQTNEANAKVYRLCKRYADKFEELAGKNQGLLFWGDVGTGKTFAAACIANELLSRRIPVVMTSFVKLLETTKNFSMDEEQMLHRLNRAKLLILDDLGAERNTDFALEKVYNIVDSRYRANLPMILTTNLNLNDMTKTTDIRYSRIYDRIFEVCYPVKFTGKSFRKDKAVKRQAEMKKLLED